MYLALEVVHNFGVGVMAYSRWANSQTRIQFLDKAGYDEAQNCVAQMLVSGMTTSGLFYQLEAKARHE